MLTINDRMLVQFVSGLRRRHQQGVRNLVQSQLPGCVQGEQGMHLEDIRSRGVLSCLKIPVIRGMTIFQQRAEIGFSRYPLSERYILLVFTDLHRKDIAHRLHIICVHPIYQHLHCSHM